MRKYPFQLPNSFIYKWECDYWVLDGYGTTREIEVKISRADFNKDAIKEKHKECNGANYFYYACPENLININEVDSKYGLIYITENEQVYIAKKPKRLNNNEFNQWKMLANKMYWKWWTLWREKYKARQITRQEYLTGFNIQLEEIEL